MTIAIAIAITRLKMTITARFQPCFTFRTMTAGFKRNGEREGKERWHRGIHRNGENRKEGRSRNEAAAFNELAAAADQFDKSASPRSLIRQLPHYRAQTFITRLRMFRARKRKKERKKKKTYAITHEKICKYRAPIFSPTVSSIFAYFSVHICLLLHVHVRAHALCIYKYVRKVGKHANVRNSRVQICTKNMQIWANGGGKYAVNKR